MTHPAPNKGRLAGTAALLAALAAGCQSPNQSAIDELADRFTILDADRDDRLSQAEFARSRIASSEQNPELFDRADADDDGYISRDEARSAYKGRSR